MIAGSRPIIPWPRTPVLYIIVMKIGRCGRLQAQWGGLPGKRFEKPLRHKGAVDQPRHRRGPLCAAVRDGAGRTWTAKAEASLSKCRRDGHASACRDKGGAALPCPFACKPRQDARFCKLIRSRCDVSLSVPASAVDAPVRPRPALVQGLLNQYHSGTD